MNIQVFEFNPLQENTYILYDETKACVIVDPGCYGKEEENMLVDFIESNELNVEALWNTHCHIDHILGNAFVKERYKTKLFIHPLDEPVLKAAKVYAPHYGIFQYQEAEADTYFKEGEFLTFGKQQLQVRFVPGHSPGHVAFYNERAKVIVAGDVLFYNSIGRTDLPGGNYDTLVNSIHQQLFTLPDDVTVYPGHGPETTIGFEKRTNPFVRIVD